MEHLSVIIHYIKSEITPAGPLPATRETGFDSWVGKIRWRKDKLPTSVFLGFPCGSAGKESVWNAGNLVLSLSWEDPLEK